ncbi:response regulator [Polaribacter sp.]|uniref:response regulator n=1 Tax=Polaribacter sp. TaxID=1920175 RepID=UPI003F6AB1BC
MINKIKILLVEDDHIEVMKLKRSISKEFDNYYLSTASNGKKALSLIEKELPDLIILDLNMPDTNGNEFLSIIKGNEDYMHIPVIVLTTSNHDKDIKECYKLGIAGYIVKPLKYEEYEAKIKAVMHYWSLNEFLKP